MSEIQNWTWSVLLTIVDWKNRQSSEHYLPVSYMIKDCSTDSHCMDFEIQLFLWKRLVFNASFECTFFMFDEVEISLTSRLAPVKNRKSNSKSMRDFHNLGVHIVRISRDIFYHKWCSMSCLKPYNTIEPYYGWSKTCIPPSPHLEVFWGKKGRKWAFLLRPKKVLILDILHEFLITLYIHLHSAACSTFWNLYTFNRKPFEVTETSQKV